MVDKLRISNAGKAQKLAAFKSGQVKMFSKEEIAAVEKKWRYWGKMRKARRDAYLEVEGLIVDSGKAKEDVREICGIEEVD